jgi:hypothetical protein
MENKPGCGQVGCLILAGWFLFASALGIGEDVVGAVAAWLLIGLAFYGWWWLKNEMRNGPPTEYYSTRRPLNFCSRCGHTWYPRGHDVSTRCPRCRAE